MSGPFCVYFLKYYVVAASADIQSFESMQFFHITPYAFFKRMVLQSADTKIRPFQHWLYCPRRPSPHTSGMRIYIFYFVAGGTKLSDRLPPCILWRFRIMGDADDFGPAAYNRLFQHIHIGRRTTDLPVSYTHLQSSYAGNFPAGASLQLLKSWSWRRRLLPDFWSEPHCRMLWACLLYTS